MNILTKLSGAATAACGLILGACSQSPTPVKTTDASGEPTDRMVLEGRVNAIDGTPVALADYKGDVVLIVNTASRCGYTRQYDGLEKLYRDKKDDGLVVLGFPANQFMGQEPGTNEEIAEFCRANYGVTFPMFEKIVVKGEGTHPLYQRLTELSQAPGWNFNKYLVDRDGNLVMHFPSGVEPSDPKLVAEIDRLLEQRAG